MSKARLALSSIVAVLSVGAIGASSATAAINFEWKVAGAKLETGESKAFTINNDSKNFGLRATVVGATALLLSHEVSVESGAKIIGGLPGTNEEVIVLKGVTIDNLASCGVSQSGIANTVKTTPLQAEVVEGSSGGTGTGEVDILFTPKTGETFATFKFTGSSCILNGSEASTSGLLLGLASPQKTEVLRQELLFEAATKEYRNSKNEFKTAGLVFAGNAATLTGLTLVILESDQIFGAF
jgi:hypothetical protein